MTVEPIRDKVNINQMYTILVSRDIKYGLLFKFALNTGLGVNDILSVKLKDVCNEDGSFHNCLILKGKMSGVSIKINDALQKEIEAYVKTERPVSNSYLFHSRKGAHIGRIQAYRVLKEAAAMVGIENFGTLSLRKTWGYWTYKLSKYNIGLIMDMFNCSSSSRILKFIGIDQELDDESYASAQF